MKDNCFTVLCWFLNLFLVEGQLFCIVVSVSAVQQCESATAHPLLPEPPSQPPPHPFRCHRDWAGLPLFDSNFPLAICSTHGNVCISVLLSQLAPPSSSAAASTSLFSYVCISIPVLQIGSSVPFS